MMSRTDVREGMVVRTVDGDRLGKVVDLARQLWAQARFACRGPYRRGPGRRRFEKIENGLDRPFAHP